MTKKRNVISPEEQLKILLESDIRDVQQKIADGIMPLNPTRFFNIGDRVQYGAHDETYIREIFENGLFYKVECINQKNKSQSSPIQIVEWYELFPYNNAQPTAFRKEETCRINQSNSTIRSLIHMVHFNGVDFDVEYQREHVWELSDKTALIDSIFNNVDIGKFVFVERSYSDTRGKGYEIIDGKQRLTAICEFYEDRFKYKGYYFSELSFRDRHKFEEHSIVYGTLRNPSKKEIYETFIKLNTCGKPMNNRHLENVKKLLDELDE